MNDAKRISGEEMYQLMNEICEFGNRIIGTPPAEKVEKFIYQKLKEAELPDVRLEKINFTRWWADRYELTIISENSSSNQTIETFPIYFSGSTKPEGIIADMVHVGYGTKGDFDTIDVKDKIALIDGKMILNFITTHKVFGSINQAKKNGAVGLVVINGSPLDAITYTFLNDGVDGWENKIPGLSVNNHDGNYLKYLISKNQGKVTVRLVQEVKTEPASSNTVIGTLPGKTDDIILIGTHTDSTFIGAVDNAGANAGLIALAKHYAKLPLDKRNKTMLFVGWSGHESAFIGVNKFVEMHEDMLDKIVTFIMLDGFGSKGWYNQDDGAVVETRLDEKRGLFISDNEVLMPFVMEATLKFKLLPAACVSAKSLPVSDIGPIIKAGIPSLLLIGKPIWYHTKYDTPDKCTPDQLERTAKAHEYIINKIHETPAQKIKEADGKLKDMTPFITMKPEVPSPVSYFSIIPDPVIAKNMVIFHPTVFTSTESIVMSFDFDFGDGKKKNIPSTVPVAIHIYRKPGIYEASLKILDNFGNTHTSKRLIRVLEKLM